MKKFMFLVCLSMLWTVTILNSGTTSSYWVPPTYNEVHYNGQARAPFSYMDNISIPLAEQVKPLMDPLELECMSMNIYFEAATESTAGKLAVAQVTINRVKSRHYPNTICGVVYEGLHYTAANGKEFPVRDRCQFSWYCDGKVDKISPTASGSKMWKQSENIAKYILKNIDLLDITDGATHYQADYIENPRWAIARHRTTQIDTHIFYNKNKNKRQF